MFKKILVSFILLYCLVLLEVSFFVHFSVSKSLFLNLVFILIIIWNLFEKPENNLGLYLAIIGGFFCDIFSPFFIGYHVLIFLGVSVFLKFIFKKYVQIPSF